MERKTIWSLRIFWLLVGFMIGQATSPSSAQIHYGAGSIRPNLGLSDLEISQIQMEQSIRSAERDRKTEEAARIKAEFEADRKHHDNTLEIATLWLTLAQREDELYAAKYNGAATFVDARKHLEVSLIKQELLKRLKGAEKNLRRKP